MASLMFNYMMNELDHVAALYEEVQKLPPPPFTWTPEQVAEDVCHNGKEYIRITLDQDIARLQSGEWYRDGEYHNPHSVHGLFLDSEEANSAGQVLLTYGLWTTNARDLSTLEGIKIAGKNVCDLRLPQKFGASGLLHHNEVRVCPDRNTALQYLIERYSRGSGLAP